MSGLSQRSGRLLGQGGGGRDDGAGGSQRGRREANANYLTDFDNRDPISGFPVYKALLCDVCKRD
jgi:hypothetical protein